MCVQFRPSHRPGSILGGPEEIDIQVFEIDAPETRLSKIDGTIRSLDAEYSPATSDPLSDAEAIKKGELREDVQANAVWTVTLIGREKRQQSVRFQPYVTGPAEHAVHGAAETMDRHLDADRKGLETHDGHSIGR
jgi:hypothetical protein